MQQDGNVVDDWVVNGGLFIKCVFYNWKKARKQNEFYKGRLITQVLIVFLW